MSMISKLALFLVVLSISVQGMNVPQAGQKNGTGVVVGGVKEGGTFMQKHGVKVIIGGIALLVVIAVAIYFALAGGKRCLPKEDTFSYADFKKCTAYESSGECLAKADEKCQWTGDTTQCLPKIVANNHGDDLKDIVLLRNSADDKFPTLYNKSWEACKSLSPVDCLTAANCNPYAASCKNDQTDCKLFDLKEAEIKVKICKAILPADEKICKDIEMKNKASDVKCKAKVGGKDKCQVDEQLQE